MTPSQSSSVILWIRLSRMIPAQATRMSTWANFSTAASKSALTESRSVTLHATASARPPAFSISPATSLAGPSSRSAITTAAPSSANRLAVAAPMPRPPPVTNATRSLNRKAPSSMKNRLTEASTGIAPEAGRMSARAHLRSGLDRDCDQTGGDEGQQGGKAANIDPVDRRDSVGAKQGHTGDPVGHSPRRYRAHQHHHHG